MFYKFEKATFLFFKKKFREISYISYTDTTKFLYLLAISGVGLGVGFPTRCRIILHLPSFSSPSLSYFRLGNAPESCSFVPNTWGKCRDFVKKTASKPAESYTHPTSCPLSYTLPYTRNCQVLLGVFIPGVGNVGDFQKTFFVERRERQLSGSSKTSDFLGQKYGCFASKVRMFSSKKSDVFVFPTGTALDSPGKSCACRKNKHERGGKTTFRFHQSFSIFA